MALEQQKQKFKSPEDLARKLESKSCYYLASRVRDIWTQVHINSRDWISTLRSQMWEFENIKLTEALWWELVDCKPWNWNTFERPKATNDNLINPENEKIKLISYFWLNRELSKELSKNLGEVWLDLFKMLSSYRKFIENNLWWLDWNIKEKIIRSIGLKVWLINNKLSELRTSEYDKNWTLRDFKNDRWIINSEIKDLFSDTSNKVLPSALALVKGNWDTKKLNKAREMFSSDLTDEWDFDKTWTSFEIHDSIANSWEVFELSEDIDYFRNTWVWFDDFEVNLLNEEDKTIEETAMMFYMAWYSFMIINDIATLIPTVYSPFWAAVWWAYYGTDAFNSEDTMISLWKAIWVIDKDFRAEKAWYQNVISWIWAIPLIWQWMRILTKSATFTKYVSTLSPEKLALFNSMKAQIAEHFGKFFETSKDVNVVWNDYYTKSAKLSWWLFEDFWKEFGKVFSTKLWKLEDWQHFNIWEIVITKVWKNKFELVENWIKTTFTKKELLAKLETTSIEARQLFLSEEKYLQKGINLIDARLNNLWLTVNEISNMNVWEDYVRSFLVNWEEISAILNKLDNWEITISKITRLDWTILEWTNIARFIENVSLKLISQSEELIRWLSFFESRFIFSRVKNLKEWNTIKIWNFDFTRIAWWKYSTQMDWFKVEMTLKQLKEYIWNLSDKDRMVILMDFKKAKLLDTHKLTKVITGWYEVTIWENNAFKARNIKTWVLLEWEDLQRFIDNNIWLLSRRFYWLWIEGWKVLVREWIIKWYEKLWVKTAWDYLAKAWYVEGDKSKFFWDWSRKLDYLWWIILRPATTVRQLIEAIPDRDIEAIFRVIVSWRKEIPIFWNKDLSLFSRIWSSWLWQTGKLAWWLAWFEYARALFNSEDFSFGEYVQQYALFNYWWFLYPIITQAVV